MTAKPRICVVTSSRADILVGDSSSGILEAPFLGCSTINIGDRQNGLLRASNVHYLEVSAGAVLDKINHINAEIKKSGPLQASLIFGCGEAAKNIASILKEKVLKIDIKKVFYDLPDTS